MGPMMDRAGLADVLRHRRQSLQPEDVGMPRGPRRRTSGLRREEAAALCHMSTDYWSRLEQERGPRPSAQMVGSIAQGLHLTVAERDHLFRLAGHPPPPAASAGMHISPGVLRILDRLADTPAEVVTELGETLRQTPVGIALLGDLTRFTGPFRSIGYRWFALPGARDIYAEEDHASYSRLYASGLRGVAGLRGPGSRAAELATLLLESSEEFREVWQRQEVGLQPPDVKRYRLPSVGDIELNCQVMHAPAQAQTLLVYTAAPGSDSHEKLELLAVLGAEGVRQT
ncbi:helix-turn-helix transcriptional regulator [Serinicoccus chungangensis]